MSYKNSKCRFLDEYANFKKSYYKAHSNDGSFNQDYARQAVKKLENIVRNAHRGMITLDEAVRTISEI